MFSLKEIISAFATILFITIIFSSLKYYYNYFTRPNPYKGPFPLPLLGNLHQIFYHRFNTPLWTHSLHLKYGDVFEIYSGSKRQLITNNLKIIEHVMKPVRNSNYMSRVPPNEGLDELGKTTKGIVVNRDIKKWAYNRKIFIRAIMAPNALKFSANLVNCVFKDLEIYWDSLIDEMGESIINQEIHQKKVLEIDLVPWIKRVFTENIMLLATNRPSNILLNYYKISKKDSNIIKTAEDEYLDGSKDALICMRYFAMIPSYIRNLPLIKIYSNHLLNKFSSRKEYVYNLINERRDKIENISDKENLTPDMLNMLLTINTPKDITQGIANDFNDKPMTDDEINDVLSETFALSCLIYYATSYPEVEENILKEIKKVFGDKSNLDYEDLKKFEYIEAVKRSLHMNPNYWNEPTKFDPSRFLKNKNHDNNNGIDEDSFIKNTFLHFGGGLRICPGRHLAINQVKLMVALLYKKYKFELVIDFLVKFESLADFLVWCVFEVFGVIRTGSSNVVVSFGVIVGGTGVVSAVVASPGFLCIYSKITIAIKLGISVALNMK
ncbi:7259_t:CDS:2 [Entrophospora sp. SA101]|nr:7259_t:CDS:2 [Entrophospora sp. SA101]